MVARQENSVIMDATKRGVELFVIKNRYKSYFLQAKEEMLARILGVFQICLSENSQKIDFE